MLRMQPRDLDDKSRLGVEEKEGAKRRRPGERREKERRKRARRKERKRKKEKQLAQLEWY